MLNSNGQASLRKHNLLFDSSSLKELLGGGSTNFKEVRLKIFLSKPIFLINLILLRFNSELLQPKPL